MQKTSAILSMIFERQSMLTTLLIALAVLFVTGMLIVLMYAGGI
jgi:hypothetical protein